MLYGTEQLIVVVVNPEQKGDIKAAIYIKARNFRKSCIFLGVFRFAKKVIPD